MNNHKNNIYNFLKNMEGGADIQESVTIITESEVESAAEEQEIMVTAANAEIGLEVESISTQILVKSGAKGVIINTEPSKFTVVFNSGFTTESEPKYYKIIDKGTSTFKKWVLATYGSESFVPGSNPQVLDNYAKIWREKVVFKKPETGEVPKKSEYKIYIFETKIPIVPEQIAKDIISKKYIKIEHTLERWINSNCSSYGKLRICDQFTNTSINNLFNNYIKKIIIEQEKDYKTFDGYESNISPTAKTTFITKIREPKTFSHLEKIITTYIKYYLSDELEYSKRVTFMDVFIETVYSWFIVRIKNTYSWLNPKNVLQKKFNVIELQLNNAHRQNNKNVLITAPSIKAFLKNVPSEYPDTYKFLLDYLFIFSINLYNLLEFLEFLEDLE